jgi:glycosyltransferase involved in cell wall biosynthesis
MKKITVIIPSLNQGKFIEKTILSLLDQDYPNLEIIVMDGGSTDSTVSILRKYDSVLTWFSEKDNGQADAINKGIRIATGEVIGFLNSDDFLLPNTLNLISEQFNDETTLWLTGDYIIVDSNDKPTQSFIVRYKRMLRRFSSRNLLLITNFIVQPSTFWMKTLSTQIGYFDESLKFVMDYDYWLRAYNISKPKIIEEPISGFRIHKQSKGGSQYKKQFQEEFLICSKYTNNKLLKLLHKIHNEFIVLSYNLIK